MSTGVSGANLPYATKYQKVRHSSCTQCHKKMPLGEVILGLRECNAKGQHVEGWYHLTCFFLAMKAKGVGVAESAIRGMSWLKWDDQEMIREQIDAFNGQASAERIHLQTCRVEHAKSAKGKCGKCKKFIPKDEAKYHCKGAFHHLPCFLDLGYIFSGNPDDVAGHAALKQDEKDAFKGALEAKRNPKKPEADVKTELTQGSSSDCSMGAEQSTSMMGGGDEGEADAANVGLDPLLAAARKMARKKKDAIILNALDTTTARDRSAPATSETSTKTAWGDDYDGEIQLLDVVKSNKPPVMTLGGGEEDAEEPKKKEERKMKEEVEVMEEEEPPKPKKSSLNSLFERMQQADKKRESLSSVMDIMAKKPRPRSEEMGKDELNEQLKKQADALWTLREQFDNLKEHEIVDLMQANEMFVPEGREKLLNSICDAALFGAPGQCPNCPDGKFIFNSDQNTYVCMGDVTEWTKCTHTNKNPYRSPLGFPRSLAKKLEPVEDTGVMNSMPRRYYPMASDAPLKKGLPSVAAVSAELAEGGSSKQSNAAAKSLMRIRAPLPAASAVTGGKQFIKKGTVVDGECTYASVAHVYRDDEKTLFSCSLTQADLATNRNSYFKMQLLQHDTQSDQFYVFKSWGRVGTELGGSETMPHYRLETARDDFTSTFLDKTGNEWEDKKYFRKRPGKMAMVDMDYSEIEQTKVDEVTPGSSTKLDKAVQALIMRIFDENMFKSALRSFDLDMDQIPLGKLSKRQLTLAYGVLNELQTMVQSKPDRAFVIDATNRFYSLIPHNFGHRAPEILDTKEIIEKKSKLIENLMDIAIAVDLMKDGGVKTGVQTMDPIDVNYLKLKSVITVVDKSDPDFAMIEKYAKHSHGSTHDTKIQITDVFCVTREGEDARFNAGLGNRTLLWHGSRLSNFVGIISQGLRIAPPEAPSSGYMFGKGIYFADMISKSANYCHSDLSQNDAFLLLCDVALGKIQEEDNATGENPLKNGCNAVKGMGYQFPDPSNVLKHKDGFVVPYGKATRALQRIYLEYNEFIVYDMSQVRIRYLVRTKMTRR